MSLPTVEQRLSDLESRLADLQAQLQTASRPTKDWRRTIGAFTDDPGMLEILRDAIRLRELDRKKTAPKKVSKRKPRR